MDNKSNKNNNMFIKAITITCLCIGVFSAIYITINSFIFVTATSTVENIPLSRTIEDLQFPSLLPIERSQIQSSGNLLEDGATTNELGDDIYSFNFALNGELLSFPAPFTEFQAMGWRVLMGPDPHTDILEPGYSRTALLARGGVGTSFDETFGVSLGNFSDEPIYARDSYIVYIRFDISLMEQGHRMFLPGNITIGSTYEEVIAMYGEPDYTSIFDEERQIKQLIYSSHYLYRVAVLHINLETNQVYYFWLASLAALQHLLGNDQKLPSDEFVETPNVDDSSENPFDLSFRDGFRTVQLTRGTATINVPISTGRFYDISESNRSFVTTHHGVSTNVFIGLASEDYITALEGRVALEIGILESRIDLGSVLDFEVSEIYRADAQALQIISYDRYLLETGVVITERMYLFFFEYMGYPIGVILETNRFGLGIDFNKQEQQAYMNTLKNIYGLSPLMR